MSILGPDLTNLDYDYGEVSDLSISLLETLEAHGATVGEGCLALTLSLGRLMNPNKMDEAEAHKFIEDILSFVGAYFAEGEIN